MNGRMIKRWIRRIDLMNYKVVEDDEEVEFEEVEEEVEEGTADGGGGGLI